MASFSSSNPSTHPVGRELSIASSFVKQYYTLLNKAPWCIHNFYSHDSTFIHGTIEMADEQYTEPIVGKEKIKMKMEDLKLNDCRAKIKQIDCLETLAGGLVIQVIGELSNNGRPMRRFLQTFVLAPSPEESSRPESDQQHAKHPAGDRRSVQQNESGATHNQKFFVLNSIFRYQDDGPENDFVDESAAFREDVVDDGSNGGEEISKQETLPKQASLGHMSKSSAPSNELSQARKPRVPPEPAKVFDDSDRIASEVDSLKISKPTEDGETKRDIGAKVVPNGTVNSDKKSEGSEKSENGKASEVTPMAAPRPPPLNEPKTWANMVRNAHPPPVSTTPISVIKSVPGDSQPSPPAQQAPTQQPPQPQSSQQPQQLSPPPQQQQAPPTQPPLQQQQQNNTRRRHIPRRPARPPKNRPRPVT